MLLHRPTQFDEKDFDKQMARLDKMIERHKVSSTTSASAPEKEPRCTWSGESGL